MFIQFSHCHLPLFCPDSVFAEEFITGKGRQRGCSFEKQPGEACRHSPGALGSHRPTQALQTPRGREENRNCQLVDLPIKPRPNQSHFMLACPERDSCLNEGCADLE